MRIHKTHFLLISISILLILNLYKLQLSSSTIKSSRWKKDRLVVIPAIYKEIDWWNHKAWPDWLRYGLDLFNKNHTRTYDVYLYQRMNVNSDPPYNWPYAINVHEEAGVFLKFIFDFYHDLPDKMLFIHANPFQHSLNPFAAAHCIRDDVYYTTINDRWVQNHPWTSTAYDPTDNQTLIYKCAKRLLTLFGYDGDAQLNPRNIQPKEHSVVSTMCCAQFYVRKERILHYTYEQWSAVYNASLQPYCASPLDRELPGGPGMKWFGGSFEYLWHIILGLYPADMLPPRAKTTTDLCRYFRPSCKGFSCETTYVNVYVYPDPKSNKTG